MKETYFFLPLTLTIKEVQMVNQTGMYKPAGNVWPDTKPYFKNFPKRAISLGFTEYLRTELTHG